MLNFNLDLQKQDNFSKAFTARMGDVGEQFSVTLFDNQTPYTPVSGDLVSFRVVTPSGKFASVAGTMSGNKATFTLNGQITSEAGYYQRAYVAVSNGTKLRTTQDLIFFSLGNSDINRGQADYYVAELDKLLQQLNDEFDKWLKDREKDYSDLLARIVALTNRMTGLETKLDDILAQLQKNMINTTNVFDSSLILMPESNVRRRVDGQTIDIRGWGSVLVDNTNTMAMFEPNKTYHAKYVAELLTLTGGSSTLGGHFGLCLYSGKTGFPTVWIVNGLGSSINNVKVGDKIELENTFTTPTELHNPDANYQILAYGRRDSTGIVDAARFHDIMIQEGSMFTGLQTNPDNTLTRFDEERLVKSILIDPKMTGTNPPTIEGGTGTPTTEVTYSSTGEMRIKNLSSGRARVYWTIQQLGLDFELSKQPFNVKLVARVTSNGSQIEVGYSGQTGNPIFNVTATMDTYTATIKAEVNNDFCIYLQQGETLVIRELYIYPANTDITSKRIATIEDGLPDAKKMVTGTPDTLSGVDANTLFNSGVWKISNGVNMPPSVGNTYFYLRVINFNVNNCLQVASLRQVTTNGVYNPTYIRQCTNGTWYEWRKLTDLFSDGRVDTKAVDFNTLVQTETVVNTSTTNSPDGAASTSWYTEVIRYGSSGNYVYQRATKISNTNKVTYARQLFNGTWTEWNLIPMEGGYLTTRSQDTSLNQFTTTQSFMIFQPAEAPVAGAYIYYVEVLAYNATSCKQRATIYGTANREFVRQKVNNVWTAWREIAFA